MNTQEIIDVMENNRELIISHMIDFVRDNMNLNYQMDLYFYPEEKTFLWFDNVGGNSWLNDDHVTLMNLVPGWFQNEDDLDYFESEGADTEFDRVIDDLNYKLDEEEHEVW